MGFLLSDKSKLTRTIQHNRPTDFLQRWTKKSLIMAGDPKIMTLSLFNEVNLDLHLILSLNIDQALIFEK